MGNKGWNTQPFLPTIIFHPRNKSTGVPIPTDKNETSDLEFQIGDEKMNKLTYSEIQALIRKSDKGTYEIQANTDISGMDMLALMDIDPKDPTYSVKVERVGNTQDTFTITIS